jgi:hypothetical protein
MTSHETQTDHPESNNATVPPPENPKKPMRHEQYLEHLQTQFSCRLDEVEIIIKTQFYEKQLHILVHLDLDPAIPILTSLYSPGKLKDARDPPSMLRSLILMLLLGFSSITQWVRRTKEDAFIAVLIGFEPGDVPGVGTYYGFMARIVNGPYRKPCRCKGIVKRSDYNIGPHLRNFKNEKKDKKAAKNDLDPYHSKSEKLAASLLADAQGARADNLYKILEDLHIKIGVIPSIREGLISDLHGLATSGDGSILQTAASSRGKPTCDCRSKGIYKCDHDRLYTSPTARWCFDHVRDTFLFGDRYYHLVVTQNGHDFPLLTYMSGGNESDYTLSLTAFDRLEKAFRENDLDITISTFIGDGHHDSYGHYHFFGEKNVIPIIPISKPSKKTYPHLSDDSDIRLDTDGVPLCPEGKRMRHHCYDKRQKKHVYCCPAKRGTHRNGKTEYVFHEQDCPAEKDCNPKSSLGPCVYLKSSKDPRLFPPILRTSQKFKDLMNQRSASERLNFINDSYGVEGTSRNADYGLIRLTLANIAHHCSVRYEVSKKRQGEKAVTPRPIDGKPAETPFAFHDSS